MLPTNEVATTKTASTLLDQMFDNFNNCKHQCYHDNKNDASSSFFEERNNRENS